MPARCPAFPCHGRRPRHPPPSYGCLMRSWRSRWASIPRRCESRRASRCWWGRSRRGLRRSRRLRRPSVRHVLPPPRGRPRVAARRGDRCPGSPPRPSSQGVRAHPVRPERRRQGRAGPDAARVRHRRGHAGPWHSHHAGARGGHYRRAGAPGGGAARRGARPGCREPFARGHVPVRCRVRRPGPAAGTGRLRYRPSLPGGRRRPESLPGPVPARGWGAGVAGGPVDAGRVRPWGYEYGQHDDFGRDH